MELRRFNHLRSSESLAPGTVLLVPQGAAPSPVPVDEDARVAVVPQRQLSYPDRDRVFYRVVPGDTLDEVARAFQVRPDDLLAWNLLDRSARLQSHMVLQLFVRRDIPLDRVRYLKEADAKVLVVGSDEFFDYFEARNGRRRMVVTVAEGDTLGSIGQRYGMSVGSMERVNRRSRRDTLHPGERLVVYTKVARKGVASSTESGVEPLEVTDPPHPDALPPYGEASSRADSAAKMSGG